MVALLDKKCRVCFIEQDLTANVHKYSEIINECLPITIEKNDGHGNKICHKCLFEITLCGELIALYKKFEGIPAEANKCYLCLKDNINLPVHGSLFRTIRKVESSLTIKKILKGNPIIGRAPWNVVKKRLRTRKVCTECYFMIDTVANLYDKIKATDEAIKKIVEETDNWLYGEDPIEADENNSFRIQNNPSTSSANDEQADDSEGSRRKVNGLTIKEEPNDSDEDDSYNSDELSELSDAEDDPDNHNFLKRIKEEVKDESNEDEEEGDESGDDDNYDANVKKEIDQLESDDTSEVKNQRRKKIKQERVDNVDQSDENEDQDEEENDSNFEESVSGKGKAPISRKTNRKIKQEVMSEESEKELDDEPDVNDMQETDDDEDEEEENFAKGKSLKKASPKGKQVKRKVKSSKNKVRLDKNKKMQNLSDESNTASSNDEENISNDKEISSCYWCKKPFNPDYLKGNLCLSCIEKYRKAMDGIHSGRTCRVFVNDLKYSNNNHKVTHGAFRKGKLNNKTTGNVSYLSDEEEVNKSSSSLPFKKNTKTVGKQGVSKLASGMDGSSKNSVPKSISGEVAKKKGAESIVPFFNNSKELTDKAQVSGSEKRKRKISVASSVSSEVNLSVKSKVVDYFNRSTDLESDSSSHVSKKFKRNGECIDNKLKSLNGWQVRVIKLSVPLSSQECTSKDVAESSKLLDKANNEIDESAKGKKSGKKYKSHSTSDGEKSNPSDTEIQEHISIKSRTQGLGSRNNGAPDKKQDVSSSDEDVESHKSVSFKSTRPGPKSKTNVASERKQVHSTSDNDVDSQKRISCKSRMPGPKSRTTSKKNDDIESQNHVSIKTRKPGPKSRNKVTSKEKQDNSATTDENCISGSAKMKITSNLKLESKVQSSDDPENENSSLTVKKAGPKSRTKNKSQVNASESSDEDSENLHNMDNENCSDGKRIANKLCTSPKSSGSIHDSDMESDLLLETAQDNNEINVVSNITNEEEEALLSEKDNISSDKSKDQNVKEKEMLNLENKEFENRFLEKANLSETADVDSSNERRNLCEQNTSGNLSEKTTSHESLAEEETGQLNAGKCDLMTAERCEEELPKDERHNQDSNEDLQEDDGNLSEDEDEGKSNANLEGHVSENEEQDPEKMELDEQDNSDEGLRAIKDIETEENDGVNSSQTITNKEDKTDIDQCE